MKKWDFDLCYIVGLSNGEWHKTVAAFEDLYDALSYARRLSRENTENGLYAVYRVDGDEMEAIYVPHGQHEGQSNCPGENTPEMDNIPSINDGSIPAGEGTVVSPYLIASAAQLDWFRDKVNSGENSICGALIADITYNPGLDVKGYDGKSPAKFTPFTPIAMDPAGYTGTFDGRGHAISGIFVDRDDSPWCGLFGLVASGGVVKDVIVRHSYFRTNCVKTATAYLRTNCAKTAMVYLGGIAGRNGGTISGCYVHATVVCASDLSDIASSYISCGGVVGYSYGTVTDCMSSGIVDVSGTVSSYIHCGGIAGFISGTCTATDCTSTCNVDVSGVSKFCIHCGGVAGTVNGKVTDCMSSGSVDVSGKAQSCIRCGGVTGYVYGTCMGTITSCASSGSVDVSGTASEIRCGGVAGVIYGTVEDCVSSGSVDIRGTATSILRGDIAGYVSSIGIVKGCMSSESVDGVLPAGEGTVVSPYLIASAAQLDWFSNQVNSGATWICGTLTADITYNAGMDVGGWDGKSPNNFTPFMPIAPNSTGYKGTFDGCGHTISGIFVDRDDSQWCGLFGNIARDGVVKGITMKNSYFRTSYAGADNVYLGGMAGRCAGTVSDCDVHATVNAASDLSNIDSSYIYCGGMTGYCCGTVIDCIYSGNVDVSGEASGIYCGGMAGVCNGTIMGCTSSGSTIVSGISMGSINCGGTAGYCCDTVTHCVSSGSIDVSGTAAYIRCGGMVGYNADTITNCTFSGNIGVSGKAKGNINCGGITGHNTGTVTNCTSSGNVDASGEASGIYCGGMVGYCDNTVMGCASTGNIIASGKAFSVYCGGIAGYVAITCAVTNCTSSGSVDAGGTATDSIDCGGAAGYVRGIVTDCTSSGGVDASGIAAYINCGGVVGYVYGTVKDCVVSGSVSVSGTAPKIRRDVIAGHVHGDGVVKDCMVKDGVSSRNTDDR